LSCAPGSCIVGFNVGQNVYGNTGQSTLFNREIFITEAVDEIETEIAKIDKKVPVLKNFVIPGGSELATRLDVARAISRRLERTFVAFSKKTLRTSRGKKKVSPHVLQYSNRLSSLLFALARLTNHKEGIQYENPTYT